MENKDAIDAGADTKDYLERISEKYLKQIRDERKQADEKQLNEINVLLKDWADKISITTQEIVNSMSDTQSNEAAPGLTGISEDLKDRQSKLILTIQDAHNKQMEILKSAIAEERKEYAQAQLIFEQTLKTRYECMVDALHEKIKTEQETRMQRALDNLERSARIESERARQSFEIQQEAELTLSTKFKSIVSDLRKSWEEEETGRAMQLEEKLRSHYSVVLEHMEAQLKMALKLQDDADKQWLEDVEERNRQQLETLKAFEEKCKRLYDTRLAEYADKTSQQIAQYEEQLLEAGTALASEKAQFESRLRRIKLACSRWKMSYQRDVHERYQEMCSLLEDRYMSEVSGLLEEITDLRNSLTEAESKIQQKEKELLKARELYFSDQNSGEGSSGVSAVSIREELQSRWDSLKTSPAERVETLVSLLDSAQVTPSMLSMFEGMSRKLNARVPIAQAISRKQFIEYKLKLSSRTGENGSLSNADRAKLITEMTDLQNNLENQLKDYEETFGESYFTVTGGDSSPSGFSNVSGRWEGPTANLVGIGGNEQGRTVSSGRASLSLPISRKSIK